MPPKCAPSKNLNTGFPHFATAKEMYAHLREITQPVRATTVDASFLNITIGKVLPFSSCIHCQLIYFFITLCMQF